MNLQRKESSLLAARLGVAFAGFCIALTLGACTSVATPQRVVVPKIVGLNESVASKALRRAGLDSAAQTGEPNSRFPSGTVVASNPSAGESVASGAIVSLTVSGGPPTGPAATIPAIHPPCVSGHATYRETASTSSICAKIGSTLTITFISSGGMSGYGHWSHAPPTISDNSVLIGGPYRSAGRRATAEFHAVGSGVATIFAAFDVTCAPSNTTPCTVPPGAFQTLTVTVVPG